LNGGVVITHSDTIADLAAQLLDPFGLRVRVLPSDSRDDAVIELSRGGNSRRYAVEARRGVRLADLWSGRQRTGDALLVLTDHVGPRTAAALRHADVNYADAAGNAWLAFDDVLIDVQGRPRSAAAAPALGGPQARPGNIFSSRRAQVVFALLAWPQLWQATHREIAKAAGVSVGLANSTLHLLTKAGYDRRETASGSSLLDHWAAAFATGLAKRIELGTFRGDLARPLVNPDNVPLCVGGESAAAELVRPITLTVYASELTPALVIANRWRTDALPNVTVRQLFWREPGGSPPDREGRAPWPLVYADLFTSDDPRLRAAAKQWRQEFV
jgi:hypothetical protein